jgi:hypothetical protein
MLQVARMASGQASHTPVLTAAGAPNVALGLQVRLSTPKYSRVLACVRQEYPAESREIQRTHARTGGRAGVATRRKSASSSARAAVQRAAMIAQKMNAAVATAAPTGMQARTFIRIRLYTHTFTYIYLHLYV